jgi:hypothetical protein
MLPAPAPCEWPPSGAGISRALLTHRAAPDEQWLMTHRWIWNRPRLQEVLTQPQGHVFVCGIALNIDHVLDLFQGLFLLHIHADTQEARLLAHDTSHPPGRTEAGRQQIREGRHVFEAQMLNLGAVALDGTASTHALADELLARVFGDR